MSKHRFTTRLCAFITVLTVLIAAVFCGIGIKYPELIRQSDSAYVDSLFDDSVVHEINIDIEESDWSELVENAAAETYYACDITIDGEKISNVGVRAKGNTSLSSVPDDSERYSLKVEFDHYSDG